MKDMLLMYARYSKAANESVLGLLGALSHEAREEGRKSYYGSLSGLARHLLDGTLYFHGLFRASLPAAREVLKGTEGIELPKGRLAIAQWESIPGFFAIADGATIALIEALGKAGLGGEGLAAPVELDWYGGKPAAVPFHFLFNQLVVHGTHHRGQISQILDELGIEHDYSGIGLEALS